VNSKTFGLNISDIDCRSIKLCEKFAHSRRFIKEDEDFFTDTPHPDAAVFIFVWIMDRYGVNIEITAFTNVKISCDNVGLDGKPKDPSIPRGSYSHAQKLHAAAMYGFGRLHGFGSLAWQKSEVSGKMIGNPSVSETVSRYMITLRKKKVSSLFSFYFTLLLNTIKVHAGEVATSARAITPVCSLTLPFFPRYGTQI
jgi:hypothetical protein